MTNFLFLLLLCFLSPPLYEKGGKEGDLESLLSLERKGAECHCDGTPTTRKLFHNKCAYRLKEGHQGTLI